MATTTTELDQAAARIASALHSYAREQGWQPDEYHFRMRANPGWGIFKVDLFAESYDGFQTRWSDDQQHQEFAKLMNYLRTKLDDDPGLYSSIGLVLSGFDFYPIVAGTPLREGEAWIADSILKNPG